MWAKLTTMMYYPVEIVGAENLPGPDQPAVYVSNHQSFLVCAGVGGGVLWFRRAAAASITTAVWCTTAAGALVVVVRLCS